MILFKKREGEKLKNNIDYVTVPNKKMLNIIQSHPNELVYVEDEDTMYCLKDNSWQKVESGSASLQFSQYDLNKMMMANHKPLTPNEIEGARETINNWRKKTQDSTFFMLLARDINYCTIFAATKVLGDFKVDLGTGVLECFDSIGTLYSVEETEENSIELWTKAKDDFVVLYLFPYDQGVIEIGD